MIHGSMALALNMLTAWILSFVVALCIVSIMSCYARSPSVPLRAAAKRRLLWSLVTIPWVASIMSVALLLLPEMMQPRMNWLYARAHFHHVYEFDFFSWHGLSLVLFCGFFLVLFSRKLRRAVMTSLDLYQLDYFSETCSANKSISVLQTDLPLAFTLLNTA